MDLISTATVTAGVTERGITLLKQLKELYGGSEPVPVEVLRLVLLDTEFNLALLEVVKSKKGVPSDDPSFFEYAKQLRLDSLSALLMEWRNIDRQFGRHFGTLRGTRGWEKISDQISEHDLLGVARFVVVRGQALRALEHIAPSVRRKLFLRVRLRNIRDALRVLQEVLRSKTLLEHLTHARPTKG